MNRSKFLTITGAVDQTKNDTMLPIASIARIGPIVDGIYVITMQDQYSVGVKDSVQSRESVTLAFERSGQEQNYLLEDLIRGVDHLCSSIDRAARNL